MMKKMTLIALLAIIATTNNISASFAQKAGIKILIAGLKARQAVKATFKKHPKKIAAVAGYIALTLSAPIVAGPINESLYEFNLKKAGTICTSKEMEKLEADIKDIETTNCAGCLNKKSAEKSFESLNSRPGSSQQITAVTIATKCSARSAKGFYTLPFTCETCHPSKKSDPK